MMQLLDLNISETITAVAVGVIGLILGLQRILKGWKETSTESNIITLMHSELERMSKQNTTLATELNKLQIEIINLNGELRKLSYENQKLHEEVTSLTAEVGRLQSVLIRTTLSAGGVPEDYILSVYPEHDTSN